MNTVTERGRLNEEIARLKVKLAEEEFYGNHLPERKSLAKWNIVMYIISIFVLGFIVYLGFCGPFWIASVVGTLFWVIWIFISIRKTGKDVWMLIKREYEIEQIKSVQRQTKLKNEIGALEKELSELPIPKFMA